jgi:hypothetical protein
MVVGRIAELRSIPTRDITAPHAVDATTALVLAGKGIVEIDPLRLAAATA